MSQSILQQAIQKNGLRAFQEAYMAEMFLRNPDLSEQQAAEALKFCWPAYARPEQLPPTGDWLVWFVLAGRGYGKTRTGAEWIREQVEERGKRRIALVAETAADARDVMVEGESGILSISPSWNKPHYEPSKRRLTWPSGARAFTYSGKEPDQLRGPQHDCAWADELAKWQYMDDAWSNLMFGLRLGSNPRVVVTTTPRPLKLIKDLLKDGDTVVTGGSTYDNQANLPESFYRQIVGRYEGTRLGAQEIYARILEDNPDALFQRERVHMTRLAHIPEDAQIRIGAVALDPAVTTSEEAADTGIICGLAGEWLGRTQYFVTHDFTCHETPLRWAKIAINAYNRLHLNMIVGEVNNGGDLIKTVIKQIDNSVRFRSVRASRGKAMRAEPISALYDQNLVHHIGVFPKLEDQMCTWSPDLPEKSPDRLDALVWLLTYLAKTGGAKASGY